MRGQGVREGKVYIKQDVGKNPVLLGPKLIFVTGFVKFVGAVARLVCPDLLG